MKLLTIIIALTLLSCSKTIGIKEPTCRFVCLLSDKYTPDSFFIRTDTLWGGGYNYICGDDLKNCLALKPHWATLCIDGSLECLRYIFNNEPSQPYIFK